MDFCRWSSHIFLIRKRLLTCLIINNRLHGGMKFDLMDFCRWSSPRRKTWWKCHRPRRWCCMTMWRSNLTRWVDEIWGRGDLEYRTDLFRSKDWNIFIPYNQIHGCLVVSNHGQYVRSALISCDMTICGLQTVAWDIDGDFIRYTYKIVG